VRKLTVDDGSLLERARAAAGAAYCPYSDFPVGAAVETEQGIFSGCNVENASYSLGQCAERVAIQSAIAAGARRLIRLAVSCVRARDSDPPGSRMPCGACRQVIAEHMDPAAEIVVDGSGAWRVEELLPAAFRLRGGPPTN
jgi:cytidine deaminase